MTSCGNTKNTIPDVNFSCNAELISNIDSNLFVSFDSTKIFFKGANFRTDSLSNSSNYSILLNNEHPYGMSVKIGGVKEKQRYQVTAWRYKNGSNANIVAEGKDFWQGQNISDSLNSRNWERLSLDFVVPDNYTGDSLKFYLWNPDTIETFFDDINIKRFSE
jgi:hypothetical protein